MAKNASVDAVPVRLVAATAILLAVAAFAVYAGGIGHEFTLWDDDVYVEQNPNIQSGLTAKTLAWAFNIGYAANWHPITWMSHALDAQLFGLDKPWGHHLTSVILHSLNAALLFLVLALMTRACWRSAFVAALFALHPLHVESVAWIAERKDVLSTFFALLAILAYLRYTRQPSLGRYLLAAAAFALGLMSKPMLVTLPVLLLMIDYWPLSRWREARWSRLIVEKLPLLAMSLASGIVTMVAQNRGQAVASFTDCPFSIRLANSVLSYAQYLVKMVWPRNLVIDCAYVWNPPVWQIIAAVVGLAGITAVAVAARRRKGYLLFGWVWYVLTLLPVIGLLQVGDQSMADRYTYIPLVGVFVMISWGATEAAGRLGVAKALPVLASAVLIALAVLTVGQVGVWQDSVSLFNHTLAIAPDNPILQNNLGIALALEDRTDEAIDHCRKALDLNPDYAKAHYNLGHCLETEGDIPGAISQYLKAVENNPDYFKAHNDLAVLYLKAGRFDDAIDHCLKAIDANPQYAVAHGTLSMAYYNIGDYSRAQDEARLCQSCGRPLPERYIRHLESRLRGGP